MNRIFRPLKFQTPVFEEGKPVFPDAPQRVTPYMLHNMRNWKWEVEIKELTLQYVMSGHIAYQMEGQTVRATRGTCFLFRPGQRLSGRAMDERPVTMFAAHFADLPDVENIRGLIHAPIREVSLFEATAEYAVKCRQREESSSGIHTETALRQLFHLLQDNLDLGHISAVQQQVEALLEQIKREPGLDWRVDVMCGKIGISRSQLTRWFNRLTGTSPNRYVIEHRIAQAIQLLGMTTSSIADIAAALGYTDVPFFIRQFRKETGMSPGSLRKAEE
ncbi:helix-turn-helix transcriptional regulator [Pontiella agarivorans]|uniref:AraC family transcriptional regulator n=1 Tax=Pontiella agarivorans TaxID=3038953 RepID=A0ABU5N0V3_9BACT|nr:AraC family transcriptional regulator [Pontiella agarivorans]MDZ8120058.1 AraC family transcriptional regulator [Pontiella agarivorans]